jgi:hypothetical protein
MDKKNIGNVNLLDLRKATAESVSEIGNIGNVNLVVYTHETAGLFNRMRFGNMNASVEVPEDVVVKVYMSPLAINRNFFKNLGSKLFILALGPVTVEPDVTAEEIEAGLGGLALLGPAMYPESLTGAIQSKIILGLGPTAAYPPFAKIKMDTLDLDENYLQKLSDGTELAVLGALHALQVLPNELIQQKIKKLFVSGKIKCREENASVLQSLLVEGSGKIKAIPAGFELVEKPLLLDSYLVESLPARKLYCTERVRIDENVTAATLDKNLEALKAEEMILCPESLKEVLVKKCNLLENRVVFYQGALWLVEDSSDLLASQLEYLEDKATLVVTGELKIAPEIDPKTLSSRLAKVHNLGVIWCTPEQKVTLQTCLGLREGALLDSTKREEAEDIGEEGPGIGNVNILTL